ncbi:MAG TPA: carboxypeptidase regulatory-like domain-containing protein, partial [Archangium sp.]|nr:carboxypeptidase regulatory-like domain-containing protein [Archangium sp.]
EVAPPLPTTSIAPFLDAVSFLYTGSNPIQQGVQPGSLEARRVAVLRGRVKTRQGSPLDGVRITVLRHPEYGFTRTRVDGHFDLAVNGGGPLTVQYEAQGFLPSQRTVQVPWADYVWLPEVVLVPLDAQATAVDFSGASGAIQVARGSVQADADGTRQATLLFAPGTQATLVLPDGTQQPLYGATVRATEYTVGEAGPASMPGELPPTSGYTYAVELSVDEALAVGAPEVRFSKPVASYVKNFLGFPVGRGEAGRHGGRAAGRRFLARGTWRDAGGAAAAGGPLPPRHESVAGARHPFHALGLQLALWAPTRCEAATKFLSQEWKIGEQARLQAGQRH